jgi:Copper amine oxidase N-terminal domain.
MKKKLSILLAVALLVCSFSLTGANAEETSTGPAVRVNDLLVSFPDAQPYVDSNNRTLIPVRFATEALGATVTWDSKTSAANIALDGITVEVPIGSKTLTVNKSDGTTSAVTMDTQAVLSSDRTYVPIRYVAESLGAWVGYSNYYNTVEICKENLTKDEITRLRAYGYCYYGGGRYIKNSDGTVTANVNAVNCDANASAEFLDKNCGYDNAREFLLRHKYSTTISVAGKLTGTTWKVNDENQARLYINEAIALVDQYWSCDGLSAEFIADTSCMYQDDYYDGFNYSCRGILKFTVTEPNSEKMKTTLKDIGITYVSGQSEYSIAFEAKVHAGASLVELDRSYNLEKALR